MKTQSNGGRQSTFRCSSCHCLAVVISYSRLHSGVRVQRGECDACGEPFRREEPDWLWIMLRDRGVNAKRNCAKWRHMPFIATSGSAAAFLLTSAGRAFGG